MIAKRVVKNNKIFFQTLKGHTEDSLKILYSYFYNNYLVLEADENSLTFNCYLPDSTQIDTVTLTK